MQYRKKQNQGREELEVAAERGPLPEPQGAAIARRRQRSLHFVAIVIATADCAGTLVRGVVQADVQEDQLGDDQEDGLDKESCYVSVCNLACQLTSLKACAEPEEDADNVGDNDYAADVCRVSPCGGAVGVDMYLWRSQTSPCMSARHSIALNRTSS